MYSYFNGKYIDSQKMCLPLLDDIIGTVRGYRIFTACRTIKGKVFHLNDHIRRLSSSAREIRMSLPCTLKELREIIQETIERNKKFSGDLLLEIIFSGGPASSNGVAPAGQTALYILTLPFKSPPDWWYEKGISLATYPYQRQWPKVKLLNYVGAVIAHQTVVKRYRAQEALFVSPKDNQTILEGTTFNFFVVKNNKIMTPALDGNILAGITRGVVIKLAKKEGLGVAEQKIRIKDLEIADEAFLTSSTRNATPVVRVNNTKIGSGRPGKITLQFKKLFEEYLEKY